MGVFDLSGFSTKHLGKFYRDITREVICTEQMLFPGTLHQCFLINTPTIFLAIWKIVSKFIDPRTVQKIKVLGTDYLGELQQVIPLNQIPAKFGGKGTKPIKMGRSADIPGDLDVLTLVES